MGLAALLTGCGQSFNYEGKWEGNRNLAVPPGEDRYLYYSVGKVEITIRNNTYKMKSSEIPTEGHVEFSGAGAKLVPEYALGVPLTPETVKRYPPVTVKPQGENLILDDPKAPDGKPLTLKRGK